MAREAISDSAPAFALPVGYAGGLRDPTTGLIAFGAREYDPAACRWTSRDPILEDGGQSNLYAYVDGDPVNRIDPTGKKPEIIRWKKGSGKKGKICVPKKEPPKKDDAPKYDWRANNDPNDPDEIAPLIRPAKNKK